MGGQGGGDSSDMGGSMGGGMGLPGDTSLPKTLATAEGGQKLKISGTGFGPKTLAGTKITFMFTVTPFTVTADKAVAGASSTVEIACTDPIWYDLLSSPRHLLFLSLLYQSFTLTHSQI